MWGPGSPRQRSEVQAVPCRAKGTGYKGPYLVSYLDTMVLHLPTSLRSSATSVRRAVFSFSRKAARMVIWFSFRRLASRERLAATLFFLRLVQYFSSCRKVSFVGGLLLPLREPNLPTPGLPPPQFSAVVRRNTVDTDLSSEGQAAACVKSLP